MDATLNKTSRETHVKVDEPGKRRAKGLKIIGKYWHGIEFLKGLRPTQCCRVNIRRDVHAPEWCLLESNPFMVEKFITLEFW